MLLVSHTAIGAAVGYGVHNPFLAFVIGIVLHFIGDFVPHGDNNAVDEYRNGFKATMHKVIIMDIVLTLMYILAITTSLRHHEYPNESAIYWGMIGGLAPDLLVALYETTKLRILRGFHRFHFWVHDYLKDYDIPLWTSLLAQSVMLLVLFKIQF